MEFTPGSQDTKINITQQRTTGAELKEQASIKQESTYAIVHTEQHHHRATVACSLCALTVTASYNLHALCRWTQGSEGYPGKSRIFLHIFTETLWNIFSSLLLV